MIPQIKSLLLPLFILLTTSSILHSQTYFTQLPDATGYADELQAHQLDSLNAAAQELTEALQNAELQGDFGVYDMGFYSHHTTYEGGIPDVMQEAIDGLSTSYYLFFGREIGEEGELKKVWVEMELPSTADFCFWEDGTLSYLRFMVESRANAAVGTSASDIFPIFTSTMNALDYMENRLDQLVDCCGSSSREECGLCSWSSWDIFEYLNTNNFIHLYGGVVNGPDSIYDFHCVCSSINNPPTLQTKSNRDGQTIMNQTNNNIYFPDQDRSLINDIFPNEVDYFDLIIITDDFLYCDPYLLSNTESLFNSSSSVAWVHLFRNPNSQEEETLEDMLFIKYKIPEDESILEGGLGETTPNIEFNDNLPNYTYRIVHRSFAPWLSFGDLFGLKHTYNSFLGDDRGFSLLDTDLDGPNNSKARVHQEAIVTLNEGLSHNHPVIDVFSSITRGYQNFKRWNGNEIGQGISGYYVERVPSPINEEYGNPTGSSNTLKISASQFLSMMEFKGKNPLIKFPLYSPNIRWRLNLKWLYNSQESKIKILGTVIGKSFPAYEAFLEDMCGNRVFIYTHTSPCESQLARHLVLPDLTTWQEFEIIVEVDINGCFGNQVLYFNSLSNFSGTMEYWNLFNLEKAPAKDCPSNPCEGVYTSEGEDLRNEFDCNE